MQKKSITKEERVALFNKLVASHGKAERKGDTIPYTSINGNMFSYISKDGFMAMKLSKNDIEDFIGKFKTSLAVSYGITQKEYVVVPDSLLQMTNEMKPYFDLSYKYASSLKPKATTKSKKKS